MSSKLISAVFNGTGQRDSAKKYESIARRTDPGFNVDNSPLPQ
jgi:hypothetical protein